MSHRPFGQLNEWNDLVAHTEQLLIDPNHPASSYVRDLAIGPFQESDCVVSEASILQILGRLDHLQDFRSVSLSLRRRRESS